MLRVSLAYKPVDPRHDVKICNKLFANVVLSGGTTFFQDIGEHMNGLTVLASSTMRPKWVFQRLNVSLPPPFLLFFSLDEGQLPACCQILFASPARLCFILRFLMSYALTVVLLHTCP